MSAEIMVSSIRFRAREPTSTPVSSAPLPDLRTAGDVAAGR